MHTSFLSEQELQAVGFKSIGTNVLLSRKASVYAADVIELGSDVRIDDFCILSGGAGIRLGNHVHIAAYAAIYGGGGVLLEDFTCLSARVTVCSESDDFTGESMTNPMVPRRYRCRCMIAPVILRRHALVGVNSTVMPGVTLEEGAAVGAHSFVNESCAAWSLSLGVPARHVRDRSRRILDLEHAFLHDARGAP